MLPAEKIRSACGKHGRCLLTSDLRPKRAICSVVVAVFLALGLMVFAAAWLEGTLRLKPPGRGLLDHYGFHACLLSAPAILLTTYVTATYFLRLMCRMDSLVPAEFDRDALLEMIRPHVRSLFLRDRWRRGLGLFMFVGTAVSFAIFRKLDDPVAYWGNDVFNAWRYRWGYYTANAVLLLIWGTIYPVAFFVALRITIAMEAIVRQLKRKGLLSLDFLHVDRCGGMASFGVLNFLIMLIYVWPFSTLYALHLTHRATYASMVLGAVAMSVAFTLQSVYGLYWVSRAISAERATVIESLNQRIREGMQQFPQNANWVVAALAYRDRVMAVESFPYSSSVSVAVNVLRAAPAVLAAARAIAGIM